MTIRQKVLHWGVLPTVLALTTFAFPLSAIDNGASGLGVACACEQGVGCVEACYCWCNDNWARVGYPTVTACELQCQENCPGGPIDP
jgi:hypothetical protein